MPKQIAIELVGGPLCGWTILTDIVKHTYEVEAPPDAPPGIRGAHLYSLETDVELDTHHRAYWVQRAN